MYFTQAFTLLELLVVMAIVAILSTIAMPAYDRYIVQAHINNIISEANIYKIKLFEGVLQDELGEVMYEKNSQQIARISTFKSDTEPEKYVIEVEAKMQTKTQKGIGLKQPKNASKPLLLQLQGSNVGEAIEWSCHVAPEYNDYVPSNCRNNDLIE